jgi:hypothetical protein
MGWQTFKLGRPGYEFNFDLNPEAMAIEDSPVAVLQRNLAGDLKKSVLKTSVPIVKLNSNYLLLPQRNQFASLAGIADTFLSFITRDDWQIVAEKNTPSTLTTVKLQNNSMTKLSAALVAAGFPGTITVTSVSQVPNVTAGPVFGGGGFGEGGFSGPDFFTGGGYDDLTRTVTLGTTLPSLNPVYITYTYTGWMVNMEKLSHAIRGGWVDRFTYDFQLTGA